ncbi:MAG: caspase family protein [Cyanobacteria bacterium HKST-UBA02]|nr:caspase family protein [Cyanobacteria bacterium HKST-UBA02]
MLELYLRSSLAVFFLIFLLAQQVSLAADTSNSKRRADKWAVVVGISKFADSSVPTMKYSRKNAEDFASFLTRECNFARDHVLLLLDEKATRKGIMLPLGDSWLPRKASKDDLVVIFLSTFGTPASLDAYRENYAVAHDTKMEDLYATGIPFRHLPYLLKSRVASERVVLIIDAPNSGNKEAIRKDLFDSNFRRDDVRGKLLVLRSSGAGEKSWDSRRYPNSVFTARLMSSIEKTSNLEAAFELMKGKVAEEVKADFHAEQNPVMEGNGSDISIKTRPVGGR